ncbi:hypothetical protein KIN20_034282 [Parelaphostrongylus tenuis]|uniref:Uncharacterized protein n=1 Tax=Parelaphostrongylus tenuis TaxID=148309 RepID=A0AAD5RA50_PARTN|nr:hypothetical protein KIN20_034282 [Parelaphostrongylus tenuis]
MLMERVASLSNKHDHKHHLGDWSRAMWQNVVNRAIRMLASGPFGSHFFSTVGTVDGN